MEVSIVDQTLIDVLMVLFSLIFNVIIVIMFILRGQERTYAEAKLGPVTNALLIPFSLLLVLNALNGSDAGRMITGFPIIIFLAFDLWYRTIKREKPYHHPDRWSLSLYAYLIMYELSGIMLSGYAFIVSRLDGYVVLASFLGSVAAYGYYQYKYNKQKKAYL
jgi:hypothetical protein